LVFESGLVIVDGYRRQREFALAKELIHTLLKRPLEPGQRAKAQLKIGMVALEEGNALQAKTLFELAKTEGDRSIQQAALNGLGDVKLFLGDLPAAAQGYQQAKQLAPDTTAAAYAEYQLGRIDLQDGHREQAVNTFERLTAHADTSIAHEARLALAIAYLTDGKDELVYAQLEHLKQGQASPSTLARASYYEALLAMDQGNEQAAQQFCERTIRYAPNTDEALDARLLLADLRLRHRPPAEIAGWLEHAYHTERLAGSHRGKLATRLADLARAQRLFAAAIRWYHEASELSVPLRGESSYRIGSCFEEGGDLELAIHWYLHVDQAPWQVRGQLAAAKLLEREDRIADAASIYHALADRAIPEADIVQERLAALRAQGIRSGE
jgi:tetratricopeptide (TPR) repeat protein